MKTIEEILLIFFDKDETEKIISAEFTSPEDVVSSMWYVKVLIGVSGWFASLSFLVAVSIIIGTNMKEAGVYLGIILCIIAGVLNRVYNKKVFIQQFALSLCLAGQAAATFFFADTGHSTVSTCVFSIVLSVLIIAAYRYTVMRFIDVQAMVISLVLLFEQLKWHDGISLLTILLAIMVFLLWIYESTIAASSLARIGRTCAYSLTFSLLAIPVLSTHKFFNWETPSWLLTTAATGGIALIFIFTQAKIYSSFNKRIVSTAFIATAVLTVVFAAITYNSPGIITALFVLVLGFFRGNRMVTVLAGLFLGAYIIMFYYNLSITLLVKSYILMGSGAFLLLAWTALMQIDRRVRK